MRRHHRLRTWDAVHRWTSLICTLFLLLLCLTGLPLIFHDEIDRAQHAALEPANVPADTPGAPLDRIVATAIARHPGKRPLFASHEPHQPRIWYVTLATTSAGADLAQVAVDARTAAVLGEPRIGREGVMGVLFSLHSDLFAGLEGKLFLGGMGLLFIVATVSGAVLYAPFLRRRAFGTIARGRGTRAHWLDVHNLLGIATLAWATVVAFTGVINTCSELLVDQWQSSMIAVPRTASHETVESPAHRAISNDAVESSEPLQMLLDRALERARGMEVAFIAFPRHVVCRCRSPGRVRAGRYAADLPSGAADIRRRGLRHRHRAPHTLVCGGAVAVGTLAFRRLRRTAAENPLGRARCIRHRHTGERRLFVGRPARLQVAAANACRKGQLTQNTPRACRMLAGPCVRWPPLRRIA